MIGGHLVGVQWLYARLGQSDLRILDASMESAESAHIPGASTFDLKAAADPDSPLSHTLPDARHFARVAAGASALPECVVVIYDSTGMAAAARAWWMFKVFGYSRVHVLDGGLAAWKAAGYPLREGLAPRAGLPQSPAVWSRADAGRVAAREAVRHASDAHAQIVDARPAARFQGNAPEPRPGIPSGHIPNSTNIPYTELLDPLGRMLPADALRARFNAAGIDPDAPAICTCGSGVTACVLALALETLGNTRVRVYDGSWSEWAQQLQTQEH